MTQQPGTGPDAPAPARVHSYWGGGRECWNADRDLAVEIEQIASAYAARSGAAVCSPCGPSSRRRRPGLAGSCPSAPGTGLKDTDAVPAMPGVHLIVDPGAPVCLIVPLTLHCLPADEAADVAASYMHRLAPGNLLAATCWRVDPPLQWAPVSSSAAASNPDISGVTFTVTDSPPASSSRAAAKSETSGTTVTGREPVMDRPGPLGEGTRVRGDANVYRQVPDLLVQKSEASGTTGTVTAPMFSPTPCLRSEVSAMTWAVAVIPPAPTSIRLARSCSSGLTATVMDSPPTCSSRTAPEVGGVRGDGYGQ